MANIRARTEEELKKKERTEAAMVLGKVWGVDNAGREYQIVLMMSKIPNERHDEALAKLDVDQ